MQIRSLTKRHKSLEEEVFNHMPVVEELFRRAENFEEGTQSKAAVDAACGQLAEDAKRLKLRLSGRAQELETAVKTYSLLEEINEIEGWIQVSVRGPICRSIFFRGIFLEKKIQVCLQRCSNFYP
jgi:hypothetical protein